MNSTFKNVAYFFFIGFGLFYLAADFLLHQGKHQSETIRLIYETFDMPFFFSAGLYGLSSLQLWILQRYQISLAPLFWLLAIVWTLFLLYLNVGFESLL